MIPKYWLEVFNPKPYGHREPTTKTINTNTNFNINGGTW